MKRLLVSAILSAIALSVIGGLTGCAASGLVTYANSEKYSVGDAKFTEKIENIEIDWPSGSVSIVSHPENTFLLSEKTDDGIPEELRVHWWLDGTTLHVRFSAPGASLRLINVRRKDLTLTVPENFSLDDVTISAASANVDVSDLAARTLSISTASGEMNIGSAADKIRLNSASGNVQLKQADKAGEVSIDTASGKIDVNLGRADKASFESASGKIKVTAASVDSLSAKSASGSVSCELENVPSECELSSVSGGVNLILPEDSDFTANVRMTSGEFDSDVALKKDGNTYICGSGSVGIDIDTTSGNVSIRQK